MNVATTRRVTSVTLVETAEDFAALRDTWDSLQHSSAETSVFTSWEWQYCWWLTYGRGHRLRVVLACEEGRPVGILPLYLRRERLGAGVKASVLRFVGTGGDTSPDDLGPILAGGREGELSRLLADYVLNALRGWDVLLVTDMPAASAFAASLEAACRRRPIAVTRGVSARILYTELPPTWEAYLDSLSRDRRWRLRNTRRKLESQAPARFFVWEDQTAIDGAVDRLTELHRRRWEAAGQAHGFSSSQYVEFHRSVIKACLDRGWLRLYCLEMDGRLIAMYYCYRFRNQIFLMQGGFEPDYARLKPGQALLGFAFEHAIREGNAVFDFLRGDHRYKDELATGARETVFLAAYRRTPAALAYRTLRELVPRLKGTVKQGLRRFGLVKEGPHSH
jgi:CelD/BcsL family acetyltransferase involved in cellulose biosynthesis